MKKLMTMILFFGVSASFAAPKESALLTSAQFKALNKEDQIKYLREVQKIFAEMAKKTLFMADQNEPNRTPANDGVLDQASDALGGFVKLNNLDGSSKDEKPLPSAPPRTVTPAEAKPVADSPVRTSKADALPDMPLPVNTSASNSAPTSKPTPAPTLAPAPAPMKSATAVASTVKRDDAPSEEDVDASQIKSYEKKKPSAAAIQTSPRLSPAPAPTVSPASAPSPSPTTTPSPVASPAPKPAPPATLTLKEMEAKNEAQLKKNERQKARNAAKTEAASADKKPASTDSAVNFRCMYSGWVVRNDPCKAQTFEDLFPKTNKLKDLLKAEQMKCEKGSMCNPILYGLKIPKDCKNLKDCADQAKPICALSRSWPTEECYKNANLSTTKVAVEINTTLSPELYENYTKDFDVLCTEENIAKNKFADFRNGKPRVKPSPADVRDDIRKTCESANQQLKLLKDQMTLVTTSKETQKKLNQKSDSKR